MIVMVIGLTALTALRVQRNAAQGDNDLVQARLNARTAIEIGLQKMDQIANWRNQFPNGPWFVNQPFANGTYSLTGVDPTDADLTDSPRDPVLLTGVGRKGVARYQLQVSVDAQVRGLSCLEAAVHAGGDVQFTNTNLASNGIVSSNANVAESGSVVDAAVEAVGTISGTGYTGTMTTGIAARNMPDPATVFDYYLANGTTIAFNTLRDGGGNLLTNPGFENDATAWLDLGQIVLTLLSGDPHGGVEHLSFLGLLGWAGPQQDITAQLTTSGKTYHAEAWVRIPGLLPADARIRIETVGSVSGTSSVGVVKLGVGSTWTLVTADLTPTWTGTLSQARFIVESNVGLAQVHVDDTLLMESAAGRTISNRILSPTSNPFGPSLNAEGIYVIDCGGQAIFIDDSTVLGTLVLLNPASNSKITGPINWQAAVPNYPVLMVSGGMQIKGRAVAAPAPTNSMNGLIYTTGSLLHIGKGLAFTGAVVSGGTFLQDALSVGYTYNSVYSDDPPPGFDEQPQMVVQQGSWRPLVN